MVLQPKLLRVLQEREIRRIGGSKPIKVDFRLISATNVNLKEKIEEKQFREDLYYRLNIIEIKIPALEDRREDIPLLADHFIKLFNAKYSLHKTLDIEAVKYLCQCSWPGNVRELRNVVERLIIQSSHDVISAKEAYEAMGMLKIKSGNQTVELDEASGDVSLKEMMENYEKKILEEYIKIYKTGTELSKRLKTDQSTISRKLSKYHISY
jgi:transcriptional regulator with PAS, ATPase and Fis domain